MTNTTTEIFLDSIIEILETQVTDLVLQLSNCSVEINRLQNQLKNLPTKKEEIKEIKDYNIEEDWEDL